MPSTISQALNYKIEDVFELAGLSDEDLFMRARKDFAVSLFVEGYHQRLNPIAYLLNSKFRHSSAICYEMFTQTEEKASEKIKTKLLNIMKDGKDGFCNLYCNGKEAFISAIKELLGSASDWANELWENLKEFIDSIVSGVSDFLTGVPLSLIMWLIKKVLNKLCDC